MSQQQPFFSPPAPPSEFSPEHHLEELAATYKGYSMHFHVPSEHSVDRQLYDMEMHLVFKSTKIADESLSADNVVLDQGSSSYGAGGMMSSVFRPLWRPPAEEKEKSYIVAVVLFKGVDNNGAGDDEEGDKEKEGKGKGKVENKANEFF